MSDILNVKVNGEWVGIPAIKGENGQGVPTGGTTGQVLVKKSNTDYDTEFKTLTATDIDGTVTSVNNVSPVNGNVTLSIPSEVTETTVSDWGFTKNTGTVTSVNNVSPVSGNVTLSIPTQASDIGAVATSDCVQIYPIVETYVNGTSWYRIYSDGWCEQGGVSSGTGGRSVALLKTYADTNYTVLVSTLSGLYNTLSVAYKTSASEIRIITHSTQSDTNVTGDAGWFTAGYLASGQYTASTIKGVQE